MLCRLDNKVPLIVDNSLPHASDEVRSVIISAVQSAMLAAGPQRMAPSGDSAPPGQGAGQWTRLPYALARGSRYSDVGVLPGMPDKPVFKCKFKPSEGADEEHVLVKFSQRAYPDKVCPAPHINSCVGRVVL